MNTYFNTDENAEGIKSYGTLRIIPQGDGYQVAKGGYVHSNGKLKQFDVLAYCDTKEEAEELVSKLITI